MVWTELHSHVPLQQLPRFHIPLDSTCCLLVTYCHEFCNREFVALVERQLEKYPIWLLITRRNLCYLSSCSFSQRSRFRRIRSSVLRDTESDCAYTKILEFVSQYILRSGNLWHLLSSGMLNKKWIFSLVISKLISAFSLVLYNLL